MSKLKTSLKKKIGGLPLYAWLAIIGGAIVLGLYLRRRGSDTAGNTGMDSQDAPTMGDLAGGDSGPIPGTAGGGAGGLGIGDPGTIPSDFPMQALPPSVSYPSYPDYGYPAGDNGPVYPPMSGPSDSVPPPTSTGAAAHSPSSGLLTAVLKSGAVLHFNPLTGIVTETAPGKSAYRVASGVKDFAAYVAGVNAKARTTQTAKAAPKKPTPKLPVKHR